MTDNYDRNTNASNAIPHTKHCNAYFLVNFLLKKITICRLKKSFSTQLWKFATIFVAVGLWKQLNFKKVYHLLNDYWNECNS